MLARLNLVLWIILRDRQECRENLPEKIKMFDLVADIEYGYVADIEYGYYVAVWVFHQNDRCFGL